MAAPIRSGGSRGRRSFNAEINVTPMVDVMLVLLIIFMITATALQRGVEVNLPKSATSNLSVPKTTPLLVTVTQDARVFISETEIATVINALEAGVAALS